MSNTFYSLSGYRHQWSVIFSVWLALLSSKAFASTETTGETLYRTIGGYGCVACHGKFADGANSAGGYIRGATLSQLESAFLEQPTMKLLGEAITEPQKRQLVDYLQALGKQHWVRWDVSDKAGIQVVEVPQNVPVQLVIYNTTFQTIEVELRSPQQATLNPIITAPEASADSEFSVQPLDTEAVSWKSTAETTQFTAFNQTLVIKPK